MAKKTDWEEIQQIIKNLAIDRKKESEERKKTEKLFQEVAEAQQKTEKGLMELKEAQQRTEEAQQQTEKGFEEMQTAVKDTQEAVKKQGENLDKASGDFTRKWGAFMESLVKGQLVDILQKWGIPVNFVTQKSEIRDKKSKDTLAEFDLMAYNGGEIVVVEVKTTLTKGKLDKFVHNLAKYKHRLPEARKKVYGAVAYLDCDEKSNEEAMEKGLFVIEAPRRDGEFAKLVNPKNFKPREF